MKRKFLSLAIALLAMSGAVNAQSYEMQIISNGNITTIDVDDLYKVVFNQKAYEVEAIPTETDLYTYVNENISLFDTYTNITFPLVAGGTYTQSAPITVPTGCKLSFAGDATQPATITFTADAGYIVGNGFSISNATIDASASSTDFIALNTTPDTDLLGATGSGDYYNIIGSIELNNVDITGVNARLINDNNVKYCVGAFKISDCNIKLTSTTASGVASDALIYFKSGFINDLTIDKSTIWNAGESDAKYFIQYNNSARASRAGYSTNSISFTNCTFYNVAKAGQWGNYSGFAGQKTSYWTMTDCIFVDCGNAQVPRRFLGGRSNQSTATFNNNTYMFDGAFESTDGVVSGYDDSGTAIEVDPGFADAANGDFTISGTTQVERSTGDPRWLPTAATE
ncbi:MAG: DUF4957 domain-containing protein [Prevotellaceae bacterium]|nr:DUF4957 domain-containing protein [Prevotellaceae bacterium]